MQGGRHLDHVAARGDGVVIHGHDQVEPIGPRAGILHMDRYGAPAAGLAHRQGWTPPRAGRS